MSATTNALKVGVPALPFGAAKKVFAVSELRVAVNVPAPVTGDPETLNIEGKDRPMLVTVPPEPVALNVPPENETPEPIDTFEKPPDPFP